MTASYGNGASDGQVEHLNSSEEIGRIVVEFQPEYDSPHDDVLESREDGQKEAKNGQIPSRPQLELIICALLFRRVLNQIKGNLVKAQGRGRTTY